MQPRGAKGQSAPETAQLIDRQIRHGENARFLRRLPGFELQRELPKPLLDLLSRLKEAESSRHFGTWQQEDSC